MISYIVASHHWPTLRDNFGATVRGMGDDEVVVVENATSIAAAYNEGQARARRIEHSRFSPGRLASRLSRFSLDGAPELRSGS